MMGNPCNFETLDSDPDLYEVSIKLSEEIQDLLTRYEKEHGCYVNVVMIYWGDVEDAPRGVCYKIIPTLNKEDYMKPEHDSNNNPE